MDNTISPNHLSALVSAKQVPSNQQPIELSNGLTIKAEGPSNVSLSVLQDAQQYVGYQEHGNASSHVNLLTSDKDVVTFGANQDLAYMEVSGVTGVADSDQAQTLNEQILDSKLTSDVNLDVFSTGQQEGNIKMEYGVADFIPQSMYGDSNLTYTQPSSDSLATNTFVADVEVVTASGNTISLSFEYKEELDTDNWGTWSKDPFETFDEFDERVEREIKAGPQSESDYRSVAIRYASTGELSEEDTKYLNQINQFLMSMAESGGQSQIDSSMNQELESFLEKLNNQGVSMSLDASYSGYAQGDADIVMDMINGTADVNIDVEQVSEVNQNRIVGNFWS